MRYSYLDIFVEFNPNEADVRYEPPQSYTNSSWKPNWHSARNGLSFYFEEQEERESRNGSIRIPETHNLFNYGLIDRELFYKDSNTNILFYILKIDKLVREELAKSGVPLTLYDAAKYDTED